MKRDSVSLENLCRHFYDWGRYHALRGTFEDGFRRIATSNEMIARWAGELKDSGSSRVVELFPKICEALRASFVEGYERCRENPLEFTLREFRESLDVKEIPLLWRGYFHNISGFGQGTRDYYDELLRRGFCLNAEDVSDDESEICFQCNSIHSATNEPLIIPGAVLSLQHAPPLHFERRKGMFNIGITTWETTLLPGAWVKKANEMDEIWVASIFNKKSFLDSGVTKPVRILPYGVDVGRFNPLAPALPSIPGNHISSSICKDFFIFISIGAYYPYKGFDRLLTAYVSEFTSQDPVILIVKIYPYFGHRPKDIHRDIRSIIERQNVRKPPRILVIRENLNREIPSLLQLADAYVSLSRGEGFCLPLLEAMAMRKTAISVAFGGQMDYLSEQNAYLVEYREVPVPNGSHPYHASGFWAEPDMDDTRYKMRRAFEKRDEAAAKARQGYEDILAKWTIGHAGEVIERYIKDVYESLLS